MRDKEKEGGRNKRGRDRMKEREGGGEGERGGRGRKTARERERVAVVVRIPRFSIISEGNRGKVSISLHRGKAACNLITAKIDMTFLLSSPYFILQHDNAHPLAPPPSPL